MHTHTSPSSSSGEFETDDETYENMDTFVHDCRNRIGALKLSLHLLEKKTNPETHSIIENVKAQIADLNDMLGNLDTIQ
jgi:hypothetical protein